MYGKRIDCEPRLSRGTAPVVAFLGKGTGFPTRFLRSLGAGLDGVGVARFGDLDSLDGKAMEARPKVLVLEDALSGDLAGRFEVYRRAAGGGLLALAYDDLASARRVAGALVGTEAFRRVAFVPMSARRDVWLGMIRLLLCGEVFQPAELLADLLTNRSPDPTPERAAVRSSAFGLTGREIEVLSALSGGASNKVIAHALGISEHTVKLHVHHILKKLPVANRTGAANWFLAR